MSGEEMFKLQNLTEGEIYEKLGRLDKELYDLNQQRHAILTELEIRRVGNDRH